MNVRLRFASDAAFQERGWFADDFALVDGADQTVWSDDVEYAEGDTGGWTTDVASWANTTGPPGWRVDSGTSVLAQYYLVEWRNYDGFDEGLKYGYDTVYQDDDGAWKVDKIAYNAPGALVWYRDTTYGNATWCGTTSRACRVRARRAASCWSTATSTRCGAPARRRRPTRRR